MKPFYPQDSRYYLQNELSERLKRRPHYSLRAFARDLEVSPSSLSEVLNGRYRFSRQRVSALAKKIKLSSEHAEHWQDLLDLRFGKSETAKKKAQLRIQSRAQTSKKMVDVDSFKMISNWEALVLLEIFGFSQPLSNAEVAKILGVRKAKVEALIPHLLRLNLIYWNQNKWSPTNDDTFVGADVPSAAIRQFHKQILKKAEKALEEQDLSRREFRSTVFSMRKEDLPALKKDLNQFWMDQIGKYAKPSGNDAIYCFSMQLFDLLKGEVTRD